MKNLSNIMFITCISIVLLANVTVTEANDDSYYVQEQPQEPKQSNVKKAKKIKKKLTVKGAAESVAAGAILSLGDQLLNRSEQSPKEIKKDEIKEEGVSGTRSNYRRKLID